MEESVNLEEMRHHLKAKAEFVIGPQVRCYNRPNTTTTTDLPYLILQFKVSRHMDDWRKNRHHPSQLIHKSRSTDTLSYDLKVVPHQYTSQCDFYHILYANMIYCGDTSAIVKRMVIHIQKLIEHELNKCKCGTNHHYMKMSVDMTVLLEFIWDERILVDDDNSRVPARGGIVPARGGIVPATTISILELPERMEIDDDQCVKDVDCVICLGRLEGGNILCMPCSHMFHANCITTWLRKSHRCPICRYAMPTTSSSNARAIC